MSKSKKMKENIEKMRVYEREMIAKYGFYSHCIPYDGYSNLHTHGFTETFKHPEISVRLPVKPEFFNAIMHELKDRLSNKEVFETGRIYYDILDEGFPVRFDKISDNLYRMVITDKELKWPEETEIDYFKNQTILDDFEIEDANTTVLTKN